VFAETDVPDRTLAEWRSILQPVSEAIDDGNSVPESKRHQLTIDASRPRGLSERLSWTWGGSPQRRAFERCHRNRHRDDYVELILAYAEHRQVGLVDATFLLRPDRRTTR
jgi:hypothetical protein